MKKSTSMTFMDHVYELRRRLFWVVLWFIGASCAVFPFFDQIIKLLMRPLGNEKLYYLTPIGGLGFMIKIGMYLGLIATLPVLMYHLYCFIAPVVRRQRARRVIFYITLSSLLAVTGIVFAYLVSLPAAMQFLTHVNINGVSPMLTVDSYLSFIIAYLLAGALLFQLPLVMVIIDSIKPTPPKQWGRYQRHMIVAAFVIAMLITPTPNVTDQILLAIPMIVMYQIGIGLIFIRHRTKKRAELRQKTAEQIPLPAPARSVTPATTVVTQARPVVAPAKQTIRPKVMDVMAGNKPKLTQTLTTSRVVRHAQLTVPAPRSTPRLPVRPVLRRSVDGISVI